MAKLERDNKGRFLPGNKEGISTEVARDYQSRSVEARKANKTIAEHLRSYLAEDVGGHTRGEILVIQAVKNHKDGKLTFKDLRDLARILGEDVINVRTEGPAIVPMTPEAIEALSKWSSKEE